MGLDRPLGTVAARGFDWERVQFPARIVGQFVELKYGKGLQEFKRCIGRVPVYGTNGRCGWHDKPLANGPGVILGRKGQGHLGVKWSSEPFWVIDTAYYAEIDPKQADLRWFYFLTEYVGLDHLKTGEKPGLPRELFCRQLFPFPPLEEQKVIARVLGVLDDKIELNRRMNQTLEALARAMFKSWFVDFDPVVSKAAGKKPIGMSAETAALFPDRFQDSVLGPIPKGWRVDKLRDLCVFAYGKALPESKRTSGTIHVYGSDGITGSHNAHLVRGPGIVIGRKGNAGRVNWAPDDFFPIDTTFFVDSAATQVPLPFLFYVLDSLDLPNLSADSAVPGLNRDVALGLDVIHPSVKAITAFESVCNKLFERMQACEQESIALATLRDALLPQLMSGELRVKQAEALLEEAGCSKSMGSQNVASLHKALSENELQ